MNKALLAELQAVATREQTIRFFIQYSRGGTCTLRLFHYNGHILARAGGGGYDKEGSCLGNAIMLLFPAELLALAKKRATHGYDIIDGTRCNELDRNARRSSKYLYGLGLYNGKASIDGACGVESVRRIAEALGFEWQSVQTGKDSTIYTLIRKEG